MITNIRLLRRCRFLDLPAVLAVMKAVLKGDDVSVMPTLSFDDRVCVCARDGSVLEQNKIWPLCCEKTRRERLLSHRVLRLA